MSDYLQQRLYQKQTGVIPTAKKNYRGLAPISLKRQEKMKLYFELRDKFLKQHKNCECGQIGCDKKATDIHHTRGRGINFLNTATWKALSRQCHRFITDNPEAAKKLGL